jgi:hypothetical protein
MNQTLGIRTTLRMLRMNRRMERALKMMNCMKKAVKIRVIPQNNMKNLKFISRSLRKQPPKINHKATVSIKKRFQSQKINL